MNLSELHFSDHHRKGSYNGPKDMRGAGQSNGVFPAMGSARKNNLVDSVNWGQIENTTQYSHQSRSLPKTYKKSTSVNIRKQAEDDIESLKSSQHGLPLDQASASIYSRRSKNYNPFYHPTKDNDTTSNFQRSQLQNSSSKMDLTYLHRQ